MSTVLGSNSASGAIATVSPARPRLRACTTGVAGGRARPQDLQGAREAAAAAFGGGVVEHRDEVAGGRRLEPALDLRPRRQQVRQGDGAEVVPERRARTGRGGLQRRDPGAHDDGDALPGGIVAALQQLEDQGRHRIDPGIAGADQSDPPASAARSSARRARASSSPSAKAWRTTRCHGLASRSSR